MRIGENTEVKCTWVEVLEIYLMEEWPDFVPDRGRLDFQLEAMKSGECLEPVDLVCSNQSGKCRIQDGRHRIVAARILEHEKILALVEYRDVNW